VSSYPVSRREYVVSVVAGLLSLAAGLVYMLGTSYEWQGVWTQTGQYLRDTILLAGPITVALACWLGATERRNGLGDLAPTAAAPAWRRHAAPLLLSLLPILIGYTCVVGFVFVRTDELSQFVSDSLMFTAIGYAAFVAFVLVGYSLGARFEWKLLPLALVIGAYATMAYLSSSPTLGNLQPIDTRDVTTARIPLHLGLIWCAWFVFVGLVALCVMCRWRLAAIGAAAVAVLCAASLISQPGFPYRRDVTAAAVSCQSHSVTICVAQVHQYLTGGIDTAVAASRAPLLGTSLAPTRYSETVQQAVGRTGPALTFATTNGRLVGSASITQPALVDELATFTFDSSLCPAQGTVYRVTATDIVEAWYRRQLHVRPFTVVDPANLKATATFNSQVSSFAALSNTDRHQWLRTHALGILHCRLPVTEVP
jgi:hypothetical protein